MGATMARTVSIEEENGVRIISFAADLGPGPLNAKDHEAIRSFFSEHFLEATADCQQVVIDLSQVMTLDSSCLGPLVQRFRDLQEQGGRMVLCGVHSQGLREIFTLTRFDRIFTITDNRAQAILKIAS